MGLNVRRANKRSVLIIDMHISGADCRLVSQPEIANKIHKPHILAFKVIQGQWIQGQTRASVWLPISD